MNLWVPYMRSDVHSVFKHKDMHVVNMHTCSWRCCDWLQLLLVFQGQVQFCSRLAASQVLDVSTNGSRVSLLPVQVRYLQGLNRFIWSLMFSWKVIMGSTIYCLLCEFYDVLVRWPLLTLCVYTGGFVCFSDGAILKGLTSKFVWSLHMHFLFVSFLCRNWFHGFELRKDGFYVFELRKDEKSFEECICVQWSFVVLILQSSY